MGRDENERTMDSSQKSRDKIWSGGQQHRHTAHLSPILILLASYSFVITINPPFFTVHVTHSWRRLINQILVYYETVNTCRALAVSSQLCTYLYIFLTHSCLKCLFYLFIYSQVNYKASSSPLCLDIVTLPSDLNQELSSVLIPPLFLSLFRLQNRLSSATFWVQKLKPLQLLIISFFFP